MNLIPWDRGKSMKTHMLTNAVFLGWLMIPLLVATVSGAEDRGGGAKQGRNSAKATFAGGCFWCMESPFDKQDGVLSVTVGYTGGQKKNPTYEEGWAGGAVHTESVQIVYDPAKISYAKMLDIFWRNVDPLTRDAQFCDHGTQYRSAIFYHDEEYHQHYYKTNPVRYKIYRFNCGRDQRLQQMMRNYQPYGTSKNEKHIALAGAFFPRPPPRRPPI